MEDSNQEKKRQYQRQWRYKNKEKLREYYREYYRKHKGKYAGSRKRAVRRYRESLTLEKKQAMCRKYHLNWQVRHPDGYVAQLMKAKEERLKIKFDVLKYYGGGTCGCVVCRESRLACLSIDHIDGGGRAHIRRISMRGQNFYKWLKRQGYPVGYQTLCMNCQWVKKYERNENAKGGKPCVQKI